MKSIGFILFLFLASCASIKIKDYSADYTQEVVGKIKSMDIKKYEYKFIKNDTVNLVKTTIVNFEINQKLISEKIFTENGTKESNFKYSKGFVVEKQVISANDTAVITFKYDKQNNIIEEKSNDSNGLFNTTTQTFDKYHNPIEIKKNFADKIRHSIYNEYDYKNKFLINKYSMDTILQKEVVMKRYFDKNGYILKSQNMNATSTSKYYNHKIDKKGNLISKTFHEADGTIIEVVNFKNTYDNVGNIKIRERFLNNKLIDKTIYVNTYY
ncbi:MAG: hypothetical protein K2Y30_17090 [Flavobacteriaceae bacterium]|nr:hypothetical protein [Flavobacteriaceae bacterium]